MVVEPKAKDDVPFFKCVKILTDILEKPILWVREAVVSPNTEEYPWYHEQFRRVPTVDECDINDYVCVFEADQQFKRDRMVDVNIVNILKRRYEYCMIYNSIDGDECQPVYDKWQNALTNFFIKYGELGACGGAIKAFMKQKHRMIWERRHGPVGSGMKEQNAALHEQKKTPTKESKC